MKSFLLFPFRSSGRDVWYSDTTFYKNFFAVWLVLTAIVFSCKKPEKLPSERQILSFTLPSYPSAAIHIDEQSGIINVSVDYGSILSGLVPQISISQGAMLVPAASVPQDFSRPVTYTVIAADGSRKVYTVKVSSLPQRAPVLTGFSKDTVRAGETVDMIGKHFDGFTSSIQLAISSSSGKDTKLSFKMIDSTRLTLTIPETVEPGAYMVKMVKGNTQAVSTKSLLVRVPLPLISSFKRRNILEGDTLVVAGRFLWPQRYDYRVFALGDKGEFICAPVEKTESKLVSDLFDPIHKGTLPPGNYKVAVFIYRGDQAWTDATQTIRVYSKELPFITGFLRNQNIYRAAEPLTMTTRGFEKLNARFCQVQLSGQSVEYNQNAIYSAAGKQLSISLPADIKPGAYTIRVAYLSDTGAILYDQDLDDIITITQ